MKCEETTAHSCFNCIFSFWIFAQESDFVIVDSISIDSNVKTKERIIFRELKFKVGDTISLADLTKVVEESEFLLLNTGLFNNVKIYYKNWEATTNRVHFAIDLLETWFIYPVPIFELADRNFNVWWTDQGRSLDRVNIGLEFAHLNFSGIMIDLSWDLNMAILRAFP